MTKVDAELKEDQTVSMKWILKTEIQFFKSVCLINWILQTTKSADSAATSNLNLNGK